ncbi:MAG: holo-ACP synthase, partial [Herbiconiux sp.]|nr:holo-ACP synthase [Herbiconiux sp.]
MIVGVGVDLVDVARFSRALERTPRLRERLFAPSEQGLPVRSLAARFAAKEALIKAVGHSADFRWHDMEVVSDEHRNPGFSVRGGVASALAGIGAERLHLSMT